MSAGRSDGGKHHERKGVPEAVLAAWDNAHESSVRERLQLALEAGRDVGGDLRGHNSASIMVVPDDAGESIHVADVNQSFGDPIADLRNADLVEIANRAPIEERFDLGTNAWFAYLNGNFGQAKEMVSRLTSEDRRGYRGAVEYLEAAVACRFDLSDVFEKAVALFTEMPEWLEDARRGAEFSEDIKQVVDLHSLQRV